MTFKLHPLHTYQMHHDRVQDYGIAGYHEWLESERCTGRSTAAALKAIGAAIAEPHRPIMLRDHPHQFSDNASCKAAFSEVVRAWILKMELKHLHVTKSGADYYLTFGEIK